MSVMWTSTAFEAGSGEGGGHLDFAVHALFAQDRDRTAWHTVTSLVAAKKSNVTDGRDAGVGADRVAELVLGFGAGGVVAEGGDAAGDIGPDGAQGEEVFVEQDLADRGSTRIAVVRLSRPMRVVQALKPVFGGALSETESRSAVRTWRTAPSSSLKQGAVDGSMAGWTISRSTPMWPAKAISTAVREQAAVGAVVVGERSASRPRQVGLACPECFEVAGAVDVGRGLAPICETTWARIEPPRRFLPRPRSMRNEHGVWVVGASCGVTA